MDAKLWAKVLGQPIPKKAVRKKRRRRKKEPKVRAPRLRKIKEPKPEPPVIEFTAAEKKDILHHWMYAKSSNWSVLLLLTMYPDWDVVAEKANKTVDEVETIYRTFKGVNPMTEPRFVNPPHPSNTARIRREDLNTYERMGSYLAQRKFNGTHSVIWIYRDEAVMWDRRGVSQTLYKISPGMKACLLGLDRDPEKELVVAGELLHTKAKSKITDKQSATDTIVLFDVLYYGDHLTQMTQVDRLILLAQLCRKPTKKEPGTFSGATARAYIVSEIDTAHLWMAESFFDDFCYHFDEIIEKDRDGNDKYPEIEGLVLRLRESRLQANSKGDVDWLIRCRKFKDKVYTF